MKHFKKGEIPDLPYKMAVKKPVPVRFMQIQEPFEVETLDGLYKGKPGDYLMVGAEGEIYPCDQSIFERTYEILLPVSASL